MKKIMFNDRYGLTEAVLDGRKTMTRRMIKSPKRINGQDVYGFIVYKDIATQEVTGVCARDYNGASIEDCEILPKYEIGETVAVANSYKDSEIKPEYIVGYDNDGTPITAIQSPGWKNKMFTMADLMPHQIRITDIRVERLQDISDDNCIREGIRYIPEINKYYFERTDREEGFYFENPREAFAALIDKVSGSGTWDKNPYVFVYQFKLVK